MKVSLILSLLVSSASAFVPSNTAKPTFTTSALSAATNDVSRSDFMKAAGAVLAGVATTSSVSLPSAFADDEVVLPSGVKYTVVKAGTGPKPEVGELAAIRFAAICEPTGNKIDDIFDTPEPYYTRVGSGGMIKGVEEVLPMMRVGDRFYLTVPVSLKSHFFFAHSLTLSNTLAKQITHSSLCLHSQGKLAFGDKGRPASAGKPRIPSNATILFEVEMVGLPGKEPELIELIGDE